MVLIWKIILALYLIIKPPEEYITPPIQTPNIVIEMSRSAEVRPTPVPTPAPLESFTGTVTMYTEGFKSCGKRPSDPGYGITASGKHVTAHHTVAMSKQFKFGTHIKIEGFDEIFEVEDRGGAIKSNDVDIYIPEKPNGEHIAAEWGVRKLTVTVLK